MCVYAYTYTFQFKIGIFTIYVYYHSEVFCLFYQYITDICNCANTDNRDDPAGGIQQLHKVGVGYLPDMITFTPDCSHLLVANEGEAGKDQNGKFFNPEGSVSIIDIENLEIVEDPDEAVKLVNFQWWNGKSTELSKEGVRWVWREQTFEAGDWFSADMEPEYIAISKQVCFII